MHHWNNVNDEDEILCCAQLFVNIEFLGCRYAAEIMKKIEIMSKEVPEIIEYRKSRRNMLKRTFVTAQDAIQARNKSGHKVDSKKPNHLQSTEYPVTKSFKLDNNNLGSSITLSDNRKIKNLKYLLKDVIVFENEEANDVNYCLNKTTACMRKIGKLDIKFDQDTMTYYYLFNEQIIAEGTGDCKKVAKKAADEDFLNVLRANCYTIRSKLKFYSGEDVIKKTGNKPVDEIKNQIQEGNLGYKLLSKLGWKGGSLDANGKGIVDPINLKIKIGRLGFGCENDKFDQKYFRNLLQNFKQNQLEYDLIFSSEFTKEERASIHQ